MPILTKKPLPWFKRDPNQPRKKFPEGERKQLGKSLRVRQIMPVLARPDGTLIDGERRLGAAEEEDLETLDVIVSDEVLSESQILVIQVMSTLQRADLSDWERVCAAERLMAINPSWSQKELGEQLRLRPPEVTKLLSPKNAVEEVKNALKDGRISLGMCYSISKNPEPEEQRRLLSMALVGVGRDQVEHERRTRKNGNGQPPAKVSRVRCIIPGSKATLTLAAEADSLDLDAIIDACQQVARLAKKAKEDGQDAKVFTAALKCKAKTGG